MISRFLNDSGKPRSGQRDLSAAARWMLLGALLLPSIARAKNIFDDDWTPPAPANQVQPADPPKTDSAPAPAPAPAPARPQDPNPSPQPAPAPEPAAQKSPDAPPPLLFSKPVPERHPIPAPADRAKSRALFKQFYSTELADRSAGARDALAIKLLAQANSVKDVPADQFVLYVGAIEAGKEASDLSACSRTADAMADAFEVDGLRIKSDAALKMTLRASTSEATLENCEAGLDLVDQLVAADDPITAGRLLQTLRTAAPNAGLTLRIQKRTKDVEALRAAGDRVAQYRKMLKTAPNDPAANLEVGQYFCFVRGDWDRGLPLLAKGSDSDLRRVALIDIAGADNSAKQADLADLWWDLSEKKTGPARAGIRQRAATWYDRALPGLTGLRKVSAEKRTDESTAAYRFDFRTDSQLKTWNVPAADWTVVPEGLQCLRGESTLEFKPKRPVASLSVTFTGHNCGAFWVLIGDGRYRIHYLDHMVGVLPPDFDRSPQPELWTSAHFDLDENARYTARFWVPKDGRPAMEFEGVQLVADKFRANPSGSVRIVSPAGLVVHSITLTMQ